MFNGFLGKGKKPDGQPDAVDSRGLEVVEDDPNTAWGLWEDAVAEQDSKFSALPTLDPSFQSTAPMGLQDGIPTQQDQSLSREARTLEQRKEDALSTVELHHHRIANTIRTLWGYKECSDYISKLILSGGDGMGQSRMGFNQDAANAMMLLAEIHDAQFGAAEPKEGNGFSDSIMRTGWDSPR
ncbi:MAG: hypothetical protein V4627_19320 [Pseudomonadota bacterium]